MDFGKDSSPDTTNACLSKNHVASVTPPYHSAGAKDGQHDSVRPARAQQQPVEFGSLDAADEPWPHLSVPSYNFADIQTQCNGQTY